MGLRSWTDLFNTFARHSAAVVGSPWAFVAAVFMILGWVVLGATFHYSNAWQLVINTLTTIITFLLVALLQNSQTRADNATQEKLNAVADGLGDLMGMLSQDEKYADLEKDVADLRAAVGLENIVSTDDEDDDGTKSDAGDDDHDSDHHG